jgi:Zn-finger nucleic acid-binding protein
MEAVVFSGVTVDRCKACAGIWFDGVEHRDLKKIKGADTLDTGSVKVGGEHEKLEGVACAGCATAMEVEGVG